MDSQIALDRIIRKAIDNGWDIYAFLEAPGEPTQWTVYDNGVIRLPLARGGASATVLCQYIFDHAFAKALWGEEKYSMTIHDLNTPSEYANSIMLQQPMWTYHLQQMVISDDRIQYLIDHVPLTN